MKSAHNHTRSNGDGRVVLRPLGQHEQVTEARHERLDAFTLAYGALGKLATLLLLPMIFLYPLAPAYAADASSTDATSTDPAPADQGASPTDSLGSDLSSAAAGIVDSVSGIFGDASSSAPTSASDASSTGSSDMGASSTDQSSIEKDATTTSETASTTEAIASTTDETSGTSTDPFATTTESGGGGAAGSDASTTEATRADAVASSTESVAPSRTPEEIAADLIRAREETLRAEIRKEVEDEYTKGCISVDATGYYCLKDRNGGSGALTPSSAISAIESRQGEGSNYAQIYITQGGVTTQLTHDPWDDSFPAIDSVGRAATWQGNVDGRWQIFYADTASSSTSTIQLTHAKESNFNPKVDGTDVVWQAWVRGNWEIFLAERLSPSEYYQEGALPETNAMVGVGREWRVTRITDNDEHDMFPAIAGGIVTWQSYEGGTWNVWVYSVKSKKAERISESADKSERPRFTITWDERTEGGGARMVGYDIASGKTVDITEEARAVNDEPKPYHPSAPISQPDQAALPTTSGSSTTAKEGDAGGGSDLPV